MTQSSGPLGLLGGTFDPIHVGHLRLALEVRDALELAEVALLPAPQPRLRDTPMVSADIRLRMVEEAIEGIAGLHVDGRELRASGPTRTVETLRDLRAEHPERCLCWIMGADAVTRLDRWYAWQELPELAHIVVACRPGTSLPNHGDVATFLDARRVDDVQALRAKPAGLVAVCDIPGLDISATGIRQRLATGRSIDYLVPDNVKAMLLSEGMYVHG